MLHQDEEDEFSEFGFLSGAAAGRGQTTGTKGAIGGSGSGGGSGAGADG